MHHYMLSQLNTGFDDSTPEGGNPTCAWQYPATVAWHSLSASALNCVGLGSVLDVKKQMDYWRLLLICSLLIYTMVFSMILTLLLSHFQGEQSVLNLTLTFRGLVNQINPISHSKPIWVVWEGCIGMTINLRNSKRIYFFFFASGTGVFMHIFCRPVLQSHCYFNQGSWSFMLKILHLLIWEARYALSPEVNRTICLTIIENLYLLIPSF